MNAGDNRKHGLVDQQLAAMKASIDGMAILDEDQVYTYVNEAHARIHGYADPAELVGENWGFFYGEAQRLWLERHVVPTLAGEGYWRGEATGTRRDGSTFPTELSITTIEGGGFVCVVRDVTERRESEQALEESQRWLAEAQRVARLGIWEWDLASGRVAWSEEQCRIYGLKPNEFGGTVGAHLERVHPDDRRLVRESLEPTLRLPGPTELENRVTRPDGEVRVVYTRRQAIRDGCGEPVKLVGTTQDITERKRTEDALRESEERYRAVMEQSTEAIWLFDPHTKRVLESNAAFRGLLGYTAEALRGMTNYDFVAHSREDVDATVERKIREGRNSPFVERRYRRRDGKLLDVEVCGTVISYQGKQVMCGVARDLTERRRAEEALGESEEQFRLLFEQAVDHLVVHDASGKVVDANTGTCRSLGYSREEMLSMHVGDYEMKLLPAPEREKQERRGGTLWQRIIANEPGAVTELHRGEHRRKDGATFPVEVRVGGVLYGGQRMILASSRDITERERLEERLVHQAFHDPLTGLPNRDLALERLGRALARADRHGGQVAMLFLDLDNFKVINDSLGHEVGDRLLSAAAGRLRECVRTGELAARLGGDEFAVVLESISDEGEAVEVARRVEERFRTPFVLNDRKLFVGTSIGVALSSREGDRGEDLMRKADVAMYRAKRKGRARYEIFRPAMDEEVRERLDLENDLRNGFERGEFEVYYQPKISVESGATAAFEALLRWNHPGRGLLLPAAFIRTLEDMGLVVPVGRWVLGEACRQARQWHERLTDEHPPAVCVNVSAHQLEQADLVEDLSKILEETGLEPRYVVLEITEGAFISEDGPVSKTLGRLKDLGVVLAMDDFGTGYSSLSYLRRLPVDYLKIDRSFVEKLGRAGEETTIVQAIVQVSHALGIKVTAEGVEKADQLHRLREMGCDLAQGYFFAKPMPAREATSYLIEGRDRR